MNPEIKMIDITINGKVYSVPAGIPILEAAQMNNIHIPRLCYHPDFFRNGVNGSGSCGLCVIKNNTTGKVIRACIMKTTPNMDISTDDHECVKARRTAMKMILANHPLECLSCIRNTNCELQTLAADMSITSNPFTNTPMHNPIEHGDHAIVINPNKCVKCARCVITCKTLQQVEALETTQDGINSVSCDIDFSHVYLGHCYKYCSKF